MAEAEKASQAERFREVARQLECDEDKDRFEENLGKLARAKQATDKRENDKEK